MPSSLSFTIIKLILIVVFLCCTILVSAIGIFNIIFGLQLIRETSRYDRANGAMIFTWGVFDIVYSLVMYYLISRKSPEYWIELLLGISIVLLTLQVIFGSAGIRTGPLVDNRNIVYYLSNLYRSNDSYSRGTLDEIHQFYQCCGLFGNRTFIQTKNNDTIVWSCCEDATKSENCTIEEAFKLGCEKPLIAWHRKKLNILGSVWIYVSVFYFLMICMAFYFKKTYTRRPDYY